MRLESSLATMIVIALVSCACSREEAPTTSREGPLWTHSSAVLLLVPPRHDMSTGETVLEYVGALNLAGTQIEEIELVAT